MAILNKEKKYKSLMKPLTDTMREALSVQKLVKQFRIQNFKRFLNEGALDQILAIYAKEAGERLDTIGGELKDQYQMIFKVIMSKSLCDIETQSLS